MVQKYNIRDLSDHLNEEVVVNGWVDRVRDQKRMQFVVLSDRTGKLQAVNEKTGKDLDAMISDLDANSTVTASGLVVPNPSVKLNGYELQLYDLNITSRPVEASPINADSSPDLRMDYRHIDLRRPEVQLIFRIQTTAELAMREFWYENDFIEMHSPKLVAGASESGAELFQLNYFGQKASLAQSPQFYKQMAMTAAWDRVFEIGPVFRANPSSTPRHDTEFTSVDAEISWIDSHHDVMMWEEQWLQYVIERVAEKHGDEIRQTFGREVVVPSTPFPKITMQEAYDILAAQGHDLPRREKGDLDPQGERMLGRYIMDNFGHQFVFVTDYPTSVRAFYHMRNEGGATTKSFDLLWNGLEVTTGAQREHRYDILREQAIEKGVDLAGIDSYLGFFKHGCPPHGGYGFGLTRMLMNLTGMQHVREVTMVYRNMERLTP